MNVIRAQEISDLPDMKHVEYNGERVYIKHVDEENQTAVINYLEDVDKDVEVKVQDLEEKKS
ncbi:MULTISPECIES: H-type small acid-soluble spore protein [Allobacillus]|uniref:Small, acid-soluble spore protein H n=1 Tax=Allobacillus salarius TaxID=1955272 RepID=A0A556PL12_9BACI|nr:H-type small acid-soluble spore protein [Allobacillus salarius]TSJ65067.1 H-type small acid-soluble spore protein [Allobacillus salarius]